MKIKLKTVRNIALGLVFLVLTFGAGFGFGQKSIGKIEKKDYRHAGTDNIIDLDLFWDVWSRLDKNFFDREKLDYEKMRYGAIKGMVASLGDPYTVFLTPQENKESKDELLGQFEGIGAQLGIKDKSIVIVAPLEGTPAYKAGIIAGDIILKVDGKNTYGWTLPQAVNKIRGPKGSKVVLNILHPGADKPVDIPIIRGTIEVKSVDTKVFLRSPDDKEAQELTNLLAVNKIAYLRLSRFGDDTKIEWEKEVKKIANSFSQGQIIGLIFDLRNNPGGYLSGAVDIASEFIAQGIIVKQEKSNGSVQTFSVSRKGKLTNIPLIILVNEGSASASEIVAGALDDYDKGTLVGKKTFGKGSIQESIDLSEGAGIHITTAKWILPKGRYINEKGIEPNIEVELDEEDLERDTQLRHAIELMSSGSL